MYLTFLPAWLACLVLYGSSEKQQLFKHPLSRSKVLIISGALVVVSFAIIFQSYPLSSSLLATLALICCFLPAVTLLSAYGRKAILIVTTNLGLFCVLMMLLGGE